MALIGKIFVNMKHAIKTKIKTSLLIKRLLYLILHTV